MKKPLYEFLNPSEADDVVTVSTEEKFEKYIDSIDADRGSRDNRFFTRNEMIKAMNFAAGK